MDNNDAICTTLPSGGVAFLLPDESGHLGVAYTTAPVEDEPATIPKGWKIPIKSHMIVRRGPFFPPEVLEAVPVLLDARKRMLPKA